MFDAPFTGLVESKQTISGSEAVWVRWLNPDLLDFAPLSEVVACDSTIGKLGVTVCYDVPGRSKATCRIFFLFIALSSFLCAGLLSLALASFIVFCLLSSLSHSLYLPLSPVGGEVRFPQLYQQLRFEHGAEAWHAADWYLVYIYI